MSTTSIEAELKRSEPGAGSSASFALPSTSRRGWAGLVELFLYALITIVVAVTEYYSERLVPDDPTATLNKAFGPIDAALSFVAQTLYRWELNFYNAIGNCECHAATFNSAVEDLVGTRAGAPVGDFALSNWIIGLVLYALWSVFAARRSTTPAHSIFQHRFVDATGQAAGALRTLLRTVIRGLVLYALPFFVFPGNRVLWLGLSVGAGILIHFMPMARTPWDLITGTTVSESFAAEPVRATGPLKASDFRVDGVRQAQNVRARRLLNAAGWGAIIVSLLIVWVVFSEALVFIRAEDFNWGLLNIWGEGRGWFPRRDLYDLPTLLVGTLWVTGIAMLVAGPVGLGVAIYLSEYAKPRIQRIVKPIIETLASVPSVVLGMFAIFFISPDVLTVFFGDIGIFSILAAGIGVGILTIPLVASISEDALRAVPMELREAAYGLGSRKITVALRVVFPAALSGISAAFIVGISRAIGETMVVAIAAGGSGGTLFEADPTEPGQTITAAMASLGAGTDQVAGSGIAFQSLYFLGALLFIMTLLLNVFSDAIVRRFREVY